MRTDTTLLLIYDTWKPYGQILVCVLFSYNKNLEKDDKKGIKEAIPFPLTSIKIWKK